MPKYTLLRADLGACEGECDESRLGGLKEAGTRGSVRLYMHAFRKALTLCMWLDESNVSANMGKCTVTVSSFEGWPVIFLHE